MVDRGVLRLNPSPEESRRDGPDTAVRGQDSLPLYFSYTAHILILRFEDATVWEEFIQGFTIFWAECAVSWAFDL